MGDGFLDDSNEGNFVSDGLISLVILILDYMSGLGLYHIGLEEMAVLIIDGFQQRAIENHWIPFDVLQHHLLTIELPSHCANCFNVITGGEAFQNFGDASQYLATLYAAIASSLPQFQSLLPKIETEIANFRRSKFAEKLCVVMNPYSVPHLLNYCEVLWDELLEAKREMLNNFLDTQIQSKEHTFFALK